MKSYLKTLTLSLAAVLMMITASLGHALFNAETASGVQKLAEKVHQGESLAKALMRQAKLNACTTGVSGCLDVAKGAPKSIKDQAADLVPANHNRNRVTLRSDKQQLEIDLAGKDHAGIPTPHTKVSPRNTRAPEHLQPAFNTSEKKSVLRPSTQQDIRAARRFLERQSR